MHISERKLPGTGKLIVVTDWFAAEKTAPAGDDDHWKALADSVPVFAVTFIESPTQKSLLSTKLACACITGVQNSTVKSTIRKRDLGKRNIKLI